MASLRSSPKDIGNGLRRDKHGQGTHYVIAFIMKPGERSDSKLEWRMCQWLNVRVTEGEVLW
jgi:hypothetical protein